MKTNPMIEIRHMPGKFGNRMNLKLLLAFCCLCLSVSLSHATLNLAWDPAQIAGASDGNGNWYDANTWWDTGDGTNYTWNGSGDEENVIFGSGAGTAGVYVVTNNSSITQPYSVTFTNPGSYTITTDGTDAGEMQTIIATGGVNSYGPAFYVATNVSALINVPWRMVGGSDIFLGSNSVLTFAQSTYGTLGQITFKGQAGPGLSICNFTNGTIGGVNNPSGTTTADGLTLNISGNAIVNFGSRFDIARGANASAGYPLANAVVNVGGPGANAQLNVNTSGGNNTGNHLQISRGGPATLNILPGGLVSTLTSDASNPSGNVRIVPDSSSQGTVNMSGGTLLVGVGPGGSPGYSSSLLANITFFDATTPSATALAVLNISNGIVAAKAIKIGNGATWTANPTNRINISGGTVYLDAPNISLLNNTGTNFALNLSGGTIAATANWSPACAVPMNLTNINGNITFQAADAGGAPHNISISGNLKGVGGFNKTGAGMLILSGTNNYSGTTVVSNGTLQVSTISLPASGPVILEGASVGAGLPVSSVLVVSAGQYWSINGNLTYDTGTPTADFNFGSFPPSTTVAPVQVNGNVVFNVTPQVTVEGSDILSGTYPLIKYTGTVSGALPTALVSLPPGAISATIVNDTANKSIDLQINSSLTPSLTWGVGNGFWDLSTANWVQAGNPVDYADGDAVTFDDSASGTSPITVTLNTSVSPNSVSAQNSTKSYIISGNGSISGSASVTVAGAAGLTLATTNTYTGGTTVTGTGLLNVNNGGDGGADSAIGTGPLTLQMGAKLDNTSGQPVTLKTSIPEIWADDFTYLGSGNFDTGNGQITLGGGVTMTVNSNDFEVDGPISDNGQGYTLTKTGNGALTLTSGNNFSGGMQLNAGTLNLNADGVVGSGPFTIAGGTIDNTSGNDVSLSTYSAMKWQNSFTFNGAANLTFAKDSATIDLGAITLTVNSNTLTTYGIISGANNVMTKAGAGAWTISGANANVAFGININDGTVNLEKGDNLAYAVAAGVVTVNTNGILNLFNPDGLSWQLGTQSGIVLSGGTVEFNGDSGELFSSILFNSGVLRNSSGSAEFTLSSGISLAGTNCDFDLTNSASLQVDAAISNTGSLYLTGNGTLILTTNNTYTGDTIIAGGTLALADANGVSGSISNTAVINVRNGAAVDVTGRGDQTLTLNSGQTLSGKGSVNGNLIASAGSTVAPGGSLTTGTLTVSGNVTLNGSLLLNLNKTNTQTSSSIAASGTMTYGGALSVTNTGPALAVGDTFQLFPSAVAGFANIILATTDANGLVYTWENDVASNGSIKVASVEAAINPNPGTIQIRQSGATLNLAWPTNAGWILQTNSVGLTATDSWFEYPGSTTLTNVSIPVDSGKTNVFFRLVKP